MLREVQRDTAGRTVFVLLGVLALVLLVATGLFQSPAAMVRGNEMSWSRALFTAINAGSGTGFSQTLNPAQFRPLGQITLLVLMIAGALVSLIGGGLAAVRILRLEYRQAQVVRMAVLTVALALPAAAAFSGKKISVVASLVTGASTVSNCGLVAGTAPGSQHALTYTVVLPFAVIGGLGVTVLLELHDWFARRRPLSTHARTVLGWTAGLYLAGFVLLGAIQFTQAAPSRAMIALVSAQSVNARTLGMPLEPLGKFAPAAQWAMVGLMIIGASSAGTGGGIKTTAIPILLRGVRRAWNGAPGLRISTIAATWVGTYLAMVAVAFIAALWLDPAQTLPADRLLFLLFSAASNVGLSHDVVAPADANVYVLSAVMLGGKLLPLGILWWAARTTESDLLPA